MPKRCLIGLLVACALGAGACGGGRQQSQPESASPEVVDESDVPGRGGPLVALGAPLGLLSSSNASSDHELVRKCRESFEQLDGFRYSVELSIGYEDPEKIADLSEERLDDEKASRINGWTAAGTPEQIAEAKADDELADAYESVQGVFEPERRRWEYSYQAPDRVHDKFLPLSPGAFAYWLGPTYEEAILIGEQSWVQIDGLWQVDDEGESGLTLDELEEFCELPGTITEIPGVDRSRGLLNGRPTARYQLGTDAFNAWAADEPDGPDLKFALMELWVDAETSLPLKFRFAGIADEPSGPDDEPIGYEFGVDFEIYDLNDPSIQIEPPIAVEPPETPGP